MDSSNQLSPSTEGGDEQITEELSQSYFADRPLLLYRSAQAETSLALQIKPKLKAGPARPRDYLLLIDTAAHMAGGSLATAQTIVHKFLPKMSENDRVAVWTANTKSANLSNGFQSCREFVSVYKELAQAELERQRKEPLTPKKEITLNDALGKAANGGADSGRRLVAAFKKLSEDFPAGATNLKDALPAIISEFDGNKDRQAAIVFFGSGQSIAGPIDADLRVSLSRDMVKKQIAFFSVPLGSPMEPYNLHGFANGTGGKVVRLPLAKTAVDKWVADMLDAAAQPILYDAEIQLPKEVAEAYPTKLPPLRPDVPTLLVGTGKIDRKTNATFAYKLTGKVVGVEVTDSHTEQTPEADEDNFFLVNTIEQWKTAKDRPSLLQADRALAYAYERNQLARADLVAQGEWAVEKNKFAIAQRLFEQAIKADPNSLRAKAGLKLVEDLRSGKKTLEDVRKLVKLKKGDKIRRVTAAGNTVKDAEELFADPAPAPAPLAPPQANQDRLNRVKAEQAVIDQQQTEIVNDAIRRSQRLVQTDPDTAHDFLKRTLDGVRTNPEISNAAKAALANRLERALQDTDIRGAVVKRDQAEALNLLAAANARSTLMAAQLNEQKTIRARMRVFHNLMNQAREQEAYRHAQAIRKDLIDQGLPVPPATTAGYEVGLAGYHLREERELRRIRQERWLAVMLQVEKSHIPFPDEPPVEFPPPAVWRELSDLRKARYESTSFGTDMPSRGIELQRLLSKPVQFPGIEDPKTTLSEALEQLAKRYNLAFDINEKAFTFENVPDVGKTEVARTPIPEMHSTLSTILRRILSRITVGSGATYLIRRDVIEITTGQFAGAEKTVRVYPVADLVIPIPNAINFSSLMTQATLFGMSAGALGGFAGIGGLRGIGAAGGGLRGLGALGGALGGGLAGLGGGNVGGLGGIGGIAGLGGGGFNQLGAQGGFQGNFQGRNNMGVGGGVVGFGGGQLGQFGNLGGQFGLQGGNQSSILITLIRQVVGKPKDWAIQFDPITGQPLNPLDDNAENGLNQENNQLGFYPPAMALAVKASSTIHNRASNINFAPGAMGGMGALQLGNRDPNVRVAGQGDERPDDKDPKKKNLDPRKVWQDALVKGVSNPGLIIATADFLVMTKKFDHAAEFLKANLRQGIVVEPWVYQSLALALRMSGGSAEEIERAEVSNADRAPKDAQKYLQAAKSLAQDEKYPLALAFCQQAALLDPSTPHAYSDALDYAELSRDGKAMEWASGSLLRHDWPTDNKKLQDRAVQKIESLEKFLAEKGRKEEAEHLRNSAINRRQRDLVIKLNWQGDADLDLHVIEPTGSACSPLNRQTVGGGILIGDTLADRTSETYLAAEAFSGGYEVEIEKVWGHPLGGKAQLKIIRNQGTPQEVEQLLTVELKSRHSERIKLKLDAGRRTETAYVSPPDEREKPEAPATAMENTGEVLQKLRTLADPEITGMARGMSGAMASSGQPILPSRMKARAESTTPANDRLLYQTRVKPFVQNAMNVTSQAVISSDRRYVRLSMSPVFNTATGGRAAPVVVNPTIPGVR